MKKALFVFSLLLSGWIIQAQIPGRISYQAVLRDNSNQLITNQNVALRISLVTPLNIIAFSERHTTTTNSNGLISIQIGGGGPIWGSLESISWDKATYRIKMEVDPNGGFAYSITGFTDILAVPYAFEAGHAKVADSIAPGRLKIGDNYQGGIIFWLDETGEHGLIVWPSTYAEKWNNGVNRFVGADANGIYGGRRNTELIISTQIQDNKTARFAARSCMNMGYGMREPIDDWYLPSPRELKLLYNQKDLIPNLGDTDTLWSSMETKDYIYWTEAEAVKLADGRQINVAKSKQLRYRCIRAF